MVSSSNKQFNVVATGRTFTDVIAHVPHSFLDEHGIPLDAGKAFDAEGLQYIRSRLRDTELVAGGTAANAIATVAALGGKAGFFGKVGRDDVGAFFLEDFERRGVMMCCEPYSSDGGASPTCLVLLTDDGHRSFALHRGCADAFTLEDFSAFDFSSTHYLLADAELLTGTEAAPVLLKALAAAKERTRLVISLHNLRCWTGSGFEVMVSFVAEKADLVIGNEAEQAYFQKSAALPHKTGQIVVTTFGPKGAEAKWDCGSVFVPGEKPPLFVSSVGAGDAFNAGLLFGLSQGLDIEASLRCGVKTALAILGEVGARPTRPLDINVGKGN